VAARRRQSPAFEFICVYVFHILQLRFSPETLANGWMDYEKGKEIAPIVFTSKVKSSKRKSKKVN